MPTPPIAASPSPSIGPSLPSRRLATATSRPSQSRAKSWPASSCSPASPSSPSPPESSLQNWAAPAKVLNSINARAPSAASAAIPPSPPTVTNAAGTSLDSPCAFLIPPFLITCRQPSPGYPPSGAYSGARTVPYYQTTEAFLEASGYEPPPFSTERPRSPRRSLRTSHRLYITRQDRGFTEEDRSLLQAIARKLGLAV